MSLYIFDDNSAAEVVSQLEGEGFLAGALPRQTAVGGLEGVPVFAEQVPLIPESEWAGRIKEMTDNKLWIGDRWQSDPNADFQDGLGFCWAYSLAQATMAVRAAQGQPFVQLSPESLAECVNYRNQGYYLDRALEYAAKNGLATRATVPQHAITERQWDAKYKEERTHFIPTEWWDIGGSDVWGETVTALLMGYGCYVGYDWASHAVWLDRIRIGSNGKVEVHTPNSHGPEQDWWLAGSKAIPSMGSFVLRDTTWRE